MSEPDNGQAEPSSLPTPVAPHPLLPAATQAAASALPLPAPGPQQPSHAYDSETATLHTDLLGDLVVPSATGPTAAQLACRRLCVARTWRSWRRLRRRSRWNTNGGDGTRRVYRFVWRTVVAWCQSLNCEPPRRL